MAHQHRAAKRTERPYSGPVAARKQNPAAHGNVTRVETCTCGAERKVNINGHHTERGPWQEAGQ